jgi:hypothetical protein
MIERTFRAGWITGVWRREIGARMFLFRSGLIARLRRRAWDHSLFHA